MAGRGLSGEWDYDRKKRLHLRLMEKDIKDFVQSLVGIQNRNSFYNLATKYITRRLIKIAADILSDAARRCPYETGKLRESGRVMIGVGKTKAANKVAAKVTDGMSEEPNVEVIIPYLQKAGGMIVSEIKFHRIVKGRDLALWAHEELLHYVKRPKTGTQIGQWYSRHFRTGPKYLENAFKLRKSEIPREIQAGLMEAVKAYNKRWKTRARRRRI